MAPKRREKADMDVTVQVPDVLPIDVTYFDPDAFTAWLAEYLGDQSERRQAASLGITRRYLRLLRAGQMQPSLDKYMRMIAVAEVPIGTWLRFGQ